MSERSVSENNKLWEAAEKAAEEVVAAKKAESEAERQKQKKRVVKLVLLMMLIALIIVFASIAWFAMNKAVTADTMAIEAKGDAYSIQPLGDKGGLYDTYIDDLGVEAIKWTLSSTNNMENRYKENGDPTSSQMAEITRLDSEQYGLKPGDRGSLKFKITSHSSDAISVTLNLVCTGYEAKFNKQNYKTDDSLTELTDDAVINYLSSHILFFYKDSSDKMHMITDEGFSVSVAANQEKEITLFWYWPATLEEIIKAQITGLSDNDAAKEVRRYFFEQPEYFLKAIGTENFNKIKVEKQENVSDEEEDIQEIIDEQLLLGRNYSQYSSKYNDADQAIGDKANYLLVELTAALDSSSNE